jgi:selenide,water dikinase
VGFPDKGDPAILEQIIRGGLDKMNEAKCSVVGGHSIRNDDIQFGYSVTGLIHPQKIWRNVGVQTNDVLLLTKPLGTGVISTALKNDRVSKEALDASIRSMTTLNRAAAEALTKLESQFDLKQRPIHAVTDVTGFGLLGHAREMALGDGSPDASPVSLEFDHTLIAALPGALEAIQAGMIPGGLKNNRDFLGDCVTFDARVSEENRALLYDPQTSGGLLIAIDPAAAQQALKALQENGVSAAKIGTVRPKTTSLLRVI